MEISVESFINFLDKRNILYEVYGSPKEGYTLASIFEPIPEGFYFYVGSELPSDIKRSLIITGRDVSGDSGENCLIKIDGNPQIIFYEFLDNKFKKKSTGRISKKAVISDKARIGENVQIDDFVIVENCDIDDNVIIKSHCKIYENTKIGSNTIIESGSVIGTEGVAWVWNNDGTKKIRQPQLGGTVIGKDCFLGANTIIVRGSLNENSIIGEDTMMAPGCRIGHGTIVGKSVHFANNVTTGGNTRIGNYCFVGSGAIIRPKIQINESTIVGAGAVVVKNSTKSGMTLVGVPAIEKESSKNPSAMPALKKTN
ncbi:MAG: hypothetical protein JJ892_12500 [Balneola sp.]|nr:hypothetical protein [Balneola sp.]MBO6651084.1 hypothetical protein [Balneola sp.]MBO6712790.1 hypothetical protein [Balneola sp.]MBO6801089.1 hypothetical protein [Balneola sp.]MBO6871281.1 hypothetical protein [Balneola sp.]